MFMTLILERVDNIMIVGCFCYIIIENDVNMAEHRNSKLNFRFVFEVHCLLCVRKQPPRTLLACSIVMSNTVTFGTPKFQTIGHFLVPTCVCSSKKE